jgi:glycosyltransferase involved in cell wall biosynthesis
MEKGLRAVFVNHIHPDTNHVSAMRMKYFAKSLAARGNKVVLISGTQAATDTAKPLPRVAHELAVHDWSRPFVLACPPTGSPLLRKAREGRLAFGLRQGILAGAYLLHGGVFTDWLKGALPYLPLLAKDFRPEIVWGTFGNTDAWNIARRLADVSGCPWVADLKDNWSAFMPTGLARLIAGRYPDAVHMTVFSEGHRDEADRWFNQDKTVIYSGFGETTAPPPRTEPGSFRILLTGSIYDDTCLARFIGGLRNWLKTSSVTRPANNVIFSYAGNDGKRVARQADILQGLCKVAIHGFLPYDELLAAQKNSSLNVYIRNSRNIFQHKILELLAAGPPVISFPGESDEAKRIAERAGGCLLPCETEEQVFGVLRRIASAPPPPADATKMSPYSWQSQAEDLENLFRRLIEDRQ